MPLKSEEQINPEFDFEAELQRDRLKQSNIDSIKKETETPGPNLNIIELSLALFLALGTDFGIGWLGGKLATAFLVIPVLGGAGMALIMGLTKLTTYVVALILGLWCLLRFKKFPWKRWGGATLIEFIPFIGEIAPGWTAFVLSIIIKEKILPIVQKYSGLAEKISQTTEKIIQASEKTIQTIKKAV